METSGFLRVPQVLSSSTSAALRAEVLAELNRQPWWWGSCSWMSKLSRSLSPTSSSSTSSSSSKNNVAETAAWSMYQEANIRSSFRRRVLKIPLSNDGTGSPLSELAHQAVRAVVRAHSERCVGSDGAPLLSTRARLVELTAVVSMPGAFAQEPHADILQEDDEDEDEGDEYRDTVGREGVVEHHRKKHGAAGGGGGKKGKQVPGGLATLLTSWVSLQPVSTSMGPTVIFPGTHVLDGLPRMAPRTVRMWRGQDFSDEDMRWIALMHADSQKVAAANDCGIVEHNNNEAMVDAHKMRKKKIERWWRRLREDVASQSTTTGSDRAGVAVADVVSLNEDETGNGVVGGGGGSGGGGGDADQSPQEMTSDVAGDMVVMDTRVWHYGAANYSMNARVLLNVTFQEEPALPFHPTPRSSGPGDRAEKGADGSGGCVQQNEEEEEILLRRIEGFTYHCHDSVIAGRYRVADFL